MSFSMPSHYQAFAGDYVIYRRACVYVGATALVAAALVAIPTAAVAADCDFEDDTPPTISNVSVSDVVLTAAGGTADVTATVVDQPTTYVHPVTGVTTTCASGVDIVTVLMYGPEFAFEYRDLELVSGDEISGQYGGSVFFAADSSVGSWEVTMTSDDNELGFSDEIPFGTFSVSLAVGGPTPPSPPPSTPPPLSKALPLGGVRIATVYYASPGTEKGSNKSLRAERLQLENRGAKTRNLRGARLRDRSGHVFSLDGDIRLAPGDSVMVHTGKGSDTRRHVYLGAARYLWNNVGDRATLRNGAGVVKDACGWRKVGRGYKDC